MERVGHPGHTNTTREVVVALTKGTDVLGRPPYRRSVYNVCRILVYSTPSLCVIRSRLRLKYRTAVQFFPRGNGRNPGFETDGIHVFTKTFLSQRHFPSLSFCPKIDSTLFDYS